MESASSSNKRHASPADQPAPSAKRAHLDASDVDSTAVALKARTAVLEDVATSVNDITKAVMRLPCHMDSAARGRIVAMLSQVEAKINAELGIKKKIIRHVLGGDPLPDIFALLSRCELDALQLVDVRFRDIIVSKMSLLCLRQLYHATLHRGGGAKEYSMFVGMRDTNSFSHYPTGEIDEYTAFVRLLSACRSSRIGHLEMDGNATIQPTHLDAVAQYAPSILVDTFRLGCRSLSKCVSHDDVRRALGSFAELKTLGIEARRYTPDMLNFLVRNAYMFELAFYESAKSTVLSWSYPELPVDEASLLAFSFGECEQRYAGRERRLTIRVSALSPLFLQRWIERAEQNNCQHRSSLKVYIEEAPDTAGLSAFSVDDDGVSKRTKLRGRSWTAVYEHENGKCLQLNFN